jgi:hypothetical protein
MQFHICLGDIRERRIATQHYVQCDSSGPNDHSDDSWIRGTVLRKLASSSKIIRSKTKVITRIKKGNLNVISKYFVKIVKFLKNYYLSNYCLISIAMFSSLNFLVISCKASE